MNVTSVAGGTSGSTSITVEPTLTGGNSYKYKTAISPTLPIYGQECKSGYTAWDGATDIASTAGQKIVVVELDAGSKCVGAGETVITVKE